MKVILAIGSITFCLSMCIACSSGSATGTRNGASRLTEDEKHRLYAAALAASDAPLDAPVFKEVCRGIGIYDEREKPNDKYLTFVGEHVKWSLEPEGETFRKEVSSKEKAGEYIRQHLPR